MKDNDDVYTEQINMRMPKRVSKDIDRLVLALSKPGAMLSRSDVVRLAIQKLATDVLPKAG